MKTRSFFVSKECNYGLWTSIYQRRQVKADSWEQQSLRLLFLLKWLPDRIQNSQEVKDPTQGNPRQTPNNRLDQHLDFHQSKVRHEVANIEQEFRLAGMEESLQRPLIKSAPRSLGRTPWVIKDKAGAYQDLDLYQALCIRKLQLFQNQNLTL